MLCVLGPVLVSESDVFRPVGKPNAANKEYFLRLGGREFASAVLFDACEAGDFASEEILLTD